MNYGPQPTGETCYCGRPNNLMDCLFPSCGGRAPLRTQDSPLSTEKDWAKVYAVMDRK